jgi:hypothetical protein
MGDSYTSRRIYFLGGFRCFVESPEVRVYVVVLAPCRIDMWLKVVTYRLEDVVVVEGRMKLYSLIDRRRMGRDEHTSRQNVTRPFPWFSLRVLRISRCFAARRCCI